MSKTQKKRKFLAKKLEKLSEDMLAIVPLMNEFEPVTAKQIQVQYNKFMRLARYVLEDDKNE